GVILVYPSEALLADATNPTVLYSEQADICSRLYRIFATFWQKLHQSQQVTA
ncbi:Hypothetical predicted protein, partial [Pelobates cultripes]